MTAELEELIEAGEDRLLIARLDDEESPPASASKESCPAPEVNGRALVL